ncbi:MAG: 30S ribosome-binding factor RbfA [Candidatus Doudnabacteria bacterium]|nr:30S ribosome-binding factor RbfA [Candidatus Doudnabacteria bacterium]
MTRRTEKVGAMIHKEVAILLHNLELPGMVTISKVEVSADLRHAKVWITILPADQLTEKKVLESLAEKMYELQGQLNKKLTMKIIPRLAFKVDYSSDYADRINQLLKRAKESL